MATGVRVQVSPDLEAMSRMAASHFCDIASRVIATGRNFTVALSGGRTPQGLFNLLSTPAYSRKVDWEQVEFFWGDERCVPPDHMDSNFRNAHEAFLKKVRPRVHRIQGELEPKEAARKYEAELREVFGANALPAFDLAIQGIGEDGHTASLFPGAKALQETRRLAVAVYVRKLRSWRVTLTIPVLCNSRNVLFMVSGRKKSNVLKEIFSGEEPEKYPAGQVRSSSGETVWLLDEAAARGFFYKQSGKKNSRR